MPKLVAHDLAARLRDHIEAGEWRRTNRLPAERALAERFGVARNTLRHALSILETEGVVVRHVGRGAFITDQKHAERPENFVPNLVDISPRDLIDARLLLEPEVAAVAAANATEQDIKRLEEAQAASQATTDMGAFEHYDAEIHRLLFSMAHNLVIDQIDAMLTGFRTNADWLSAKRRAYSPELKAKYVSQHGDIIDAIRHRSPKAARTAMTTHLEEVRRVLLEL